MRAVAGGGRYDNLLEVLGGPRMPAVGFGMGDVVLADLLDSLGKLPAGQRRIDAFLIDANESYFPKVLELAGKLRLAGLSASFSYKRAGLSRQLKSADQHKAHLALILAGEMQQGKVAVKHMASGVQVLMDYENLAGRLLATRGQWQTKDGDFSLSL